jgi:hypothetical protein
MQPSQALALAQAIHSAGFVGYVPKNPTFLPSRIYKCEDDPDDKTIEYTKRGTHRLRLSSSGLLAKDDALLRLIPKKGCTVRELAVLSGVAKRNVHNALRRFLIRGMVKFTLTQLPELHKCMGPREVAVWKRIDEN